MNNGWFCYDKLMDIDFSLERLLVDEFSDPMKVKVTVFGGEKALFLHSWLSDDE